MMDILVSSKHLTPDSCISLSVFVLTFTALLMDLYPNAFYLWTQSIRRDSARERGDWTATSAP